jgi:hypothetical protein
MADSIQDAIKAGTGRERALMGAAAIWATGAIVAIIAIWRANATPPVAASSELPTPQSTLACVADDADEDTSATTTPADDTAEATIVPPDDTAGAMVFPPDELIARPIGVTEAQKP